MTGQPLYVEPETWAELAAVPSEGAVYIAGGTETIPLMRSGIVNPSALVNLRGLIGAGIELQPEVLAIGGLARLSDVAAHLQIRALAPAIVQTLSAGASAQIRNMATVGGNLLQRTRCSYFRDPTFPCNKRVPESGCPALDGETPHTALFGASAQCVAVHASDLAVALSALDASVRLRTVRGQVRSLSIDDFYRLPGDRPDVETALEPREMIVQVDVPLTGLARRSLFAKVRERASFAFALVSAAVALDLDKGRIREARIALGGVAPKPWRLPDVEARLRSCPPSEEAFQEALTGFEDDARMLRHNAFKLPLARNLILRSFAGLARVA
jgi:CO/xanthine dehydrogenase FAD-binding subunit